jgi:hypothetical protein
MPPPPPPPAETPETLENSVGEEKNDDSESKDVDVTALEHPSTELESGSSNDTATDENAGFSNAVLAESSQTAPMAISTDASSSDDQPAKEEREDDKIGSSDSEEDYDSDEAVGKEEAAREHGIDEDEESIDDVQINPYDGHLQVVASGESGDPLPEVIVPASTVTVMLQRLLNMNENQSGQMAIRVAGEGEHPVAMLVLGLLLSSRC